MFVRRSSDGQFTQSLFQGSDYWVQAVSDAVGSVELMAVSSCDLDFRPRFEGVSGANPSLGTIVLNETHLHQVGAIIWQPRLLQDVFRWHRRRLDQTRRPLG